MTEIIGVTDDPRNGVASGGTGLYEFWTADGVPVYLHDTTLIGLEWQPVRRWLGLRFVYDDPQWTPPAAVRTPIVAMDFEGVVIFEWSQDNEGFEGAPAEFAGQVEDFSYDGRDGFELVTAQSVLGFTARRLTVALKSAESGRLDDG